MVKKIQIPIYEATVYLVISGNIYKERKKKKWNKIFGKCKLYKEYYAFCCSSGGEEFGLFFKTGEININVLSHEIFHLTHRMLHWAGADFDVHNHESFALLHGYLMHEVCEVFKKDKKKQLC